MVILIVGNFATVYHKTGNCFIPSHVAYHLFIYRNLCMLREKKAVTVHVSLGSYVLLYKQESIPSAVRMPPQHPPSFNHFKHSVHDLISLWVTARDGSDMVSSDSDEYSGRLAV